MLLNVGDGVWAGADAGAAELLGRSLMEKIVGDEIFANTPFS